MNKEPYIFEGCFTGILYISIDEAFPFDSIQFTKFKSVVGLLMVTFLLIPVDVSLNVKFDRNIQLAEKYVCCCSNHGNNDTIDAAVNRATDKLLTALTKLNRKEFTSS